MALCTAGGPGGWSCCKKYLAERKIKKRKEGGKTGKGLGGCETPLGGRSIGEVVILEKPE